MDASNTVDDGHEEELEEYPKVGGSVSWCAHTQDYAANHCRNLDAVRLLVRTHTKNFRPALNASFSLLPAESDHLTRRRSDDSCDDVCYHSRRYALSYCGRNKGERYRNSSFEEHISDPLTNPFLSCRQYGTKVLTYYGANLIVRRGLPVFRTKKLSLCHVQ
jgi:hypothetical protein